MEGLNQKKSVDNFIAIEMEEQNCVIIPWFSLYP